MAALIKKKPTVLLVSTVPIYCVTCGKKLKLTTRTQMLSFKSFYPIECASCFTWYQYMNKKDVDHIAQVWRIMKYREGIN